MTNVLIADIRTASRARVLRLLPLGAVWFFIAANNASAQPPGAEQGGMPWQVAAMFTANWVLAAVAVAILSRPNVRRGDKPKKSSDEEDSQ